MLETNARGVMNQATSAESSVFTALDVNSCSIHLNSTLLDTYRYPCKTVGVYKQLLGNPLQSYYLKPA